MDPLLMTLLLILAVCVLTVVGTACFSAWQEYRHQMYWLERAESERRPTLTVHEGGRYKDGTGNYTGSDDN